MAKKKKDPVTDSPAGKETKGKKLARFKASAEEARNRTNTAKQMFASMGKLWWELGAHIKACIDDFVPEALGLKATEWMKDCFGDSWLKVYRAHKAVAALPGIPQSKLEKISEGNAYQLARLPAKTRKDSAWIDKAIKLPNEDFKEVVEKQREKKGVKRDPMVKWNEIFRVTSVPKTLAELMKHALDLACKNSDSDPDTKEGRINAIELIFSEFVTTQAREQEQIIETTAQAIGKDRSETYETVTEGTYGDLLPEDSEIGEVQEAVHGEYVEQQQAVEEEAPERKKRGRKAVASF